MGMTTEHLKAYIVHCFFLPFSPTLPLIQAVFASLAQQKGMWRVASETEFESPFDTLLACIFWALSAAGSSEMSIL